MKKLVLSLSLAGLLLGSIGISTLASENLVNNESINQVDNLSNEDLNLKKREGYNLTLKLNKINEDVANGILTAEEAATMKEDISEKCANRNLSRNGEGCGLRNGTGNGTPMKNGTGNAAANCN